MSYAAKKIAEVYEKYLSGMKVYWSVVPDKNYFAARKAAIWPWIMNG